MQRHSGTLVVLALLLSAPLGTGLSGSAAAGPPVREVSVSGAAVDIYPAYDEAIDRYAVRTGDGTAGTVTVTATTTDPEGTIRVDGRPAANGAATVVDGLSPGDEVNVQITDTGGSLNQSFLFLPPGFPQIDSARLGAGPDAGVVFVVLSSFLSPSAYETALDDRGVPVHVAVTPKSHDLKPSARGDGHFTVARLLPGSTNEDAGYQIDELGRRFNLVDTHTLRPVRRLGLRRDDTDFHDVQLLPDGRTVLIGYQPFERRNGRTWLDAVIQVLDRRGRVDFTWTSKRRVKPREAYVLGSRGQDYAHINSVEMQPNGDLVASFRSTGQVLRIATRKHHGHRPGDVIWRLGGERNEFDFVNDPYGGFCAQHDARILPNGHLMLFDNGSERVDGGALSPQTADMCPDPADPGGDRIARPQTRVVEYALRPRRGTAKLVWSHEVPGRYSTFAGNAQRLDTGHSLVGWWNAQDRTAPQTAVPFVTEVDAAGTEVWSLTAPGWFSYRAHKGRALDRIRPGVQLVAPRPGAVYAAGEPVLADFRCTDAGGSNLDACAGDVVSGAPLDTSPGQHTFRVQATDRSGNQRTRTVTYTVE